MGNNLTYLPNNGIKTSYFFAQDIVLCKKIQLDLIQDIVFDCSKQYIIKFSIGKLASNMALDINWYELGSSKT